MMTRETAETYLNDGLLTVFIEPGDQALMLDVNDCCLYTQLAAAKQFSKFTQYRDWQDTLVKALAAFGWIRLDLVDEPLTQRDSVVISEVLGQLLPDALSGWHADKLDGFLASLLTASDNKASRAIIEQCVKVTPGQLASDWGSPNEPKSSTSVVLQIAFVLPSREMVHVCMAYQTLETLEVNPFAQRLNTQQLVGDLKTLVFVGLLDDVRYAQFRKKIGVALAEKRAQLSFQIVGQQP